MFKFPIYSSRHEAEKEKRAIPPGSHYHCQKMVNKVLLANGIAAFLFLAGGVVELAFCLVVRSQRDDVATEGKEAVRNLLYQDFPLTAGIVNAAFTLAAFLVMALALLTNSKGWLRFGGYAVAFCGLFTMCVGVFLWVMTLTIGEEFFDTYLGLEPETQSLIQASVSFFFFSLEGGGVRWKHMVWRKRERKKRN